MSDRLTLAHAFEDAGIPREKAEQVATAVLNAIRDNVATKAEIDLARADLLHMEDRLSARIDLARADLSHTEDGLNARIDLARADLSHTEDRLNARVSQIDSKIDRVTDRLLIRLGGLMVVAAGALFAALHHWPPHP